MFLALLAISYLYTAFGSLSTGNLINSQGETRLNLKLGLITTAIGFPLSVILIPRFGIIGLVATALTAGIPSLIIALSWIRSYTVTVDWTSSAKILLSSTVAAIVTYAIMSQLSFSSWMKLIIGLAIFLSVSPVRTADTNY